MRRFLGFIFQLIAVILLVGAITVLWIVFDGLNDVGHKADVALVTAHGGHSDIGVDQTRLDHVVTLYKNGDFPAIIVGGPVVLANAEETGLMRKYLEDHGVPSDAIIMDDRAVNTPELAADVKALMKKHGQESVMLIADYYRMTRLKLTLQHEGVTNIVKSHSGSLDKSDLIPIGREVLAVYDYLGRTYLLPAAEKVGKEAEAGVDKTKAEMHKAKDSVNGDLNNLSK